MRALRKIAQNLQIKGLTEVLQAAVNSQCKVNENESAPPLKPSTESVSSPEQSPAKRKRRRLEDSESNDVSGETRCDDVSNEAPKALALWSPPILPIDKIKVQPIIDKEVGAPESFYNDTMDKAQIDDGSTGVTNLELPARSPSSPTITPAEGHSVKGASTSHMTSRIQPSRITNRRQTIRDADRSQMSTNDCPSPNTCGHDYHSVSCDENELIDDYVETWR